MTGEEMEKAIAFILNQQAQFAANQSKAEERITRLEEAQENTARQIGRLSEALIELTTAHTRTEESLAQLAQAQAHSDQKLDALVDIVRGMQGGLGQP
jgi:flagellin-like hook-associated protein FlgL